MKTYATALALVLALSASSLPAQEEDTAPEQAGGGDFFAKVVSTTGPAEYAVADQDELAWKALEANLELPPSALIRTGFRAKVTIEFGTGDTIEINRVTMAGLRKLAPGSDRKETRTQVGIKYGTIRAKVEKKKAAPGRVEIATPVASLVVGGSEAKVGYSVDRCMGIQTSEGTWQVRRGCRKRNISAGDETDCSLAPGIVLKLYRRDSYMGGPLGLTRTERHVDVFRGTGRGWVGLPGSQWTVSGTPTKKLTHKNEPTSLDLVNP